jgi:ParB/RepB/Spo0J family partition protein
MKTRNTHVQQINIEIERILVDPKFNARKAVPKSIAMATDDPNYNTTTHAGLRELRRSIEKDGLLNLITVEPAEKNKYRLIAGFRRYLCVRELLAEGKVIPGITGNLIPVHVYESGEKEAIDRERDAKIINLVENVQRENLAPWELAERCYELTQPPHSMTSLTVAGKINKSKGYIHNLIRTLENVHPTILEAWRRGNALCTTDYLNRMAKITHDEQLEQWRTDTSDDGAGDGSGNGATGAATPATPKPFKATRKHLEALLKLASRKDFAEQHGDDYQSGMLAALRLALGKTKSIKGVYDPRAKPTAEAEGE